MNTTASNIDARKTALELNLTKIAGTACEITVRGENQFTVAMTGNNKAAISKIHNFLLAPKDWKVEYDAELDESFAYFSLYA